MLKYLIGGNLKYLLLGIIKIYQLIPGPWHNMCRYTPTCSNYSIEALKRFGAFKGTLLAIKRIIKCNPFGPSGFDPVPLKKEKKR